MQLSSLQKGLVLHLPLDEESFNPATKRFTDKSAYSNHGTGNGTQLGGSPAFQADHMGQLVRAAPFNGSDDYINCGNDSSLDMDTSDFSISAWVKLAGTGYRAIYGKYVTWAGAQTVFGVGSNNKLYFRINDNVNSPTFMTGSTTFTNEWYHATVVRDSGFIYLYLNSVSDATPVADVTGNVDSTGSSDIGRRQIAEYHFNGSINDVRIYNRALSQQEITLLYESYRPKVIV